MDVSGGPFEHFLDHVRRHFWKLPPVEPRQGGCANTVENVAAALLSDLSDTEVNRLAGGALRYPVDRPALVSALFVSDAASGELPHDFVRKVIVSAVERALRHEDQRIRQEDDLRHVAY
jgi:hypothetical protein